MTDTIFALATAPGRAALAVVRVSGPGAAPALQSLCGFLPKPRRASLRRRFDPVSRETLDQALVVFMPGPKSFTGEDVVELHLHGGPAVTDAVLSALAGLGLRPAGPGDFTRRAFEHGRLDLTEAEAIADLIDAESAAALTRALDVRDMAVNSRPVDVVVLRVHVADGEALSDLNRFGIERLIEVTDEGRPGFDLGDRGRREDWTKANESDCDRSQEIAHE